MNGMSETRKAIMARLGFAAGEKAAFGTNKRIIRHAGHEFLAEDEGNRTRISIKVDGAWEHATTVNTDNQTATEWIEANAKPGDPSRWLPHAFSRPGAKAEMAAPRFRAFVYRGTPSGSNVLAKATDWVATASEAESAARQVVESMRNKPGFNSANYFADIAQETPEGAKTIKNNVKMSRPGAKAAFAADAGAVAKEILRQLGGGRFMSMVGGKNAFHGNFGGKPGLQVDIGKGAEGGINRVIVTLDPATDTYNMEFWRIAKGGLSTKKVSEASGVYADDLQRVFTSRTKFYTSMSRPGAKAKFAARVLPESIKQWESLYGISVKNEEPGQWELENAKNGQKHNIDARSWKDLVSKVATNLPNGDYRIKGFTAEYRGIYSRPGEKAAFGNPERLDSLIAATYRALRNKDKAAARRLLAEAAKEIDSSTPAHLVYDFKDLKASMSRPGAKEAMGRAEDIYRKLSSGSVTYANAKEWERLAGEALRLPDFTPAGTDWSLHELAEEIGQEILAMKSRASRPGAKSTHAVATPAMRDIEKKMRDLMREADALTRQSLSATISSEKRNEIQDKIERISDTLDVLGEELGKHRKAAGFSKSTHAADGFYGDSEAEAVRHMSAEAEAEDIKLGDKIKMATDPAVGRKISKLMDEGYPQNQAIAIALDMKRKGEI